MLLGVIDITPIKAGQRLRDDSRGGGITEGEVKIVVCANEGLKRQNMPLDFYKNV